MWSPMQATGEKMLVSVPLPVSSMIYNLLCTITGEKTHTSPPTSLCFLLLKTRLFHLQAGNNALHFLPIKKAFALGAKQKYTFSLAAGTIR